MLRRFLDSPWPYFVAAGLLAIVAIASQFEIRLPSRAVEQPEAIRTLRDRDDINVVFILIDTLRADRLGIYGYPRSTSPTIDALGSQGIVLERVVSQSSWTKASMASLWTGSYPASNGIIRYNHAIPDEAVLPAERFFEAGFRTAGIWRNGWVAPNFGFGQGFEFYVTPKPGRERERMQRGNPFVSNLQGSDEDIVTSTFEFLDNFGQEKFFLYLHFMDLHQYVYDEKGERFGSSYSDVYDQSLNWTDRLIGVILDKLDKVGVMKRTVIVIASDHGEAFLEHGSEGHARNLYSEVVHVPVIISLPFRLENGIRIDQLVSNADVWPTLLDLLGLPPLVNPDGVSLMPLILDSAGVASAESFEPRPVFAHLDRRWGSPKNSDPLVSVTDGDMRFTWLVNRPQIPELYDLATDPDERINLATENTEDTERLKEIATRYFEESKSPWGRDPVEVELDELRLNQLRALGYVIR